MATLVCTVLIENVSHLPYPYRSGTVSCQLYHRSTIVETKTERKLFIGCYCTQTKDSQGGKKTTRSPMHVPLSLLRTPAHSRDIFLERSQRDHNCKWASQRSLGSECSCSQRVRDKDKTPRLLSSMILRSANQMARAHTYEYILVLYTLHY